MKSKMHWWSVIIYALITPQLIKYIANGKAWEWAASILIYSARAVAQLEKFHFQIFYWAFISSGRACCRANTICLIAAAHIVSWWWWCAWSGIDLLRGIIKIMSIARQYWNWYRYQYPYLVKTVLKLKAARWRRDITPFSSVASTAWK